MSARALHVMLVNGGLYGGGAEHVIGTLARHLRQDGCRVTVAVVHGGGEVQRELEHEGFEVVSDLAAGASALAAHRRIVQLARERSVDVVHSHDLRSLVDVGLARLRHRGFVHVHTFHFGNYPFVSRKHLLMESTFARVPDQLVAVGNAQRASIIKAMRLSPARIRTIWNGVDRSDAARRTGPAPSVPLIGSMSTLGPQKGVPTLLEAAALLKSRGVPFRLMIVGDGELRPQLEAQRTALGLGTDVEFTGWRNDAVTALLPTFDIFVQSSYWEAMSVVILEAMATRRPIVATTVGENPSVLADGQTALLVPPKDAVALADALAVALENPDLRQRLGDAAYAAYTAGLTGEAMGQRYQTLYRDLLRGGRRPAWIDATATEPPCAGEGA